MNFNKKSTFLSKFHDLTAAIIAVLWSIPFYAFVLAYLYSYLQTTEVIPNYYEIRFFGWVIITCVVGIIYAGVLIWSEHSYNPNADNNYKYSGTPDKEFLFMVLFPVSFLWLIAFSISYLALYILLFPAYLITDNTK
jgi:hypothetical protein